MWCTQLQGGQRVRGHRASHLERPRCRSLKIHNVLNLRPCIFMSRQVLPVRWPSLTAHPPSVNVLGGLLHILNSLLLGASVCVGGTMLSPLRIAFFLPLPQIRTRGVASAFLWAHGPTAMKNYSRAHASGRRSEWHLGQGAAHQAASPADDGVPGPGEDHQRGAALS